MQSFLSGPVAGRVSVTVCLWGYWRAVMRILRVAVVPSV